MYKALVAKYEADLLESKATLEVYFNNSVGIGEHPQHLEEMDGLVDKMASASDKLESLKDNFDNFGEEMEHIVKTTPKEVLKKEWDKVLAEYGTDTHDKILSMTDDFVQSNRSEGQTYAHYHYDMMADFALHILETFKTK